MNYAIIANDTITAHGSARELWPDTGFSEGIPNESWLTEHGAVAIRSDMSHDTATEYLDRVDPYLLDGEVFDRVAVTHRPPPPTPDWIGYQGALSAAPGVGALLAACLSPAVAPIGGAQIYGGLVVGLGQIATGGSVATFLTAWNIAQSAGLVSPELIAEMAKLAKPFNLPDEFIESLTVP